MASLYHAFKSGTLTDNPLTNVATTANSAGFSALPVIANPDFGWLVLDPEGSAGTPEIVQMTAHSSSATSGTIVRGQQTALGGSTARQHNVGTKWVLALTPSDLAYLLNKVLTTKGDIAVFGTDVTRLPVGTNGQALKANSTQATGLEWAAVRASEISSEAWTDFTPSLRQTGAVTKTVTYARYQKVGRMVTVAMRLDVTGTGTAGQDIIVGLPPFTPVGGNDQPLAGWFTYFDASSSFFYSGVPVLVGSEFRALRLGTAGSPYYFGSGPSAPNAALTSPDVVLAAFTYESTT